MQVCDFVEDFRFFLVFYVFCLINLGLSFCRGPVCCRCFAYRWLTHVMHSDNFRIFQIYSDDDSDDPIMTGVLG